MNATEIEARLERVSTQLNFLVERQRKKEELFDELSPILREVMATATSRLDEIEKKGWFDFGRAVAEVAARVLDHYTAKDVRAFGDAIVSILDTVRALTQPEVLAVVAEAGDVLQHADDAKPIGLMGMVRATRQPDVQKGIAVVTELLRHVGSAAHSMAERAPATRDRQARLAETLGPRRKKLSAEHRSQVLGVERAPAKPAASVTPRPAASATPTACATPKAAAVASVVDGVAFTAEGHLADPSVWTRQLAQRIADREGIALTPERWNLVDSARADFEQNHVAANIRRLTQIASVSTKDIYAAFPKAPGRTIARIAGTPKPVGCI